MMARLLAALALGVLIGGFTGLSASPVVGSLLSAITGGALVVLNIQSETREQNIRQPRLSSRGYVAIAVFAIAVTISALFGVWARAHELLGPSLTEQKAAWVNLGFSDDQARALVAA